MVCCRNRRTSLPVPLTARRGSILSPEWMQVPGRYLHHDVGLLEMFLLVVSAANPNSQHNDKILDDSTTSLWNMCFYTPPFIEYYAAVCNHEVFLDYLKIQCIRQLTGSFMATKMCTLECYPVLPERPYSSLSSAETSQERRKKSVSCLFPFLCNKLFG